MTTKRGGITPGKQISQRQLQRHDENECGKSRHGFRQRRIGEHQVRRACAIRQ